MSTITDLSDAVRNLVAADASLVNEVRALVAALALRPTITPADQEALDTAVSQVQTASSDIAGQVEALVALQGT